MKNKRFFTVLALFFACTLFPADQQTYRDAQGRTTGTASTNGNTTTDQDAQGRAAGTATQSGSTTTNPDSQGRTSGTKR